MRRPAVLTDGPSGVAAVGAGSLPPHHGRRVGDRRGGRVGPPLRRPEAVRAARRPAGPRLVARRGAHASPTASCWWWPPADAGVAEPGGRRRRGGRGHPLGLGAGRPGRGARARRGRRGARRRPPAGRCRRCSRRSSRRCAAGADAARAGGARRTTPCGPTTAAPVDRDGLVAVQTPQAFRAGALRAAHAGGRRGHRRCVAGRGRRVARWSSCPARPTTEDHPTRPTWWSPRRCSVPADAPARRRHRPAGAAGRAGLRRAPVLRRPGRAARARRRARSRASGGSPGTATPTSSPTPSPTPCWARPASATSASTSPTPIPRWPGPTRSTCCAGPSPTCGPPGGRRRTSTAPSCSRRRSWRRERDDDPGPAVATRSARRSPSRASGPRASAPSAGPRASRASRSPSWWGRRDAAPRRAVAAPVAAARAVAPAGSAAARGAVAAAGGARARARAAGQGSGGQGRGGRRPPPTRITTPGGGQRGALDAPGPARSGRRRPTAASAATRSRAARPCASCSSPGGDRVREVWMVDDRDDSPILDDIRELAAAERVTGARPSAGALRRPGPLRGAAGRAGPGRPAARGRPRRARGPDGGRTGAVPRGARRGHRSRATSAPSCARPSAPA